MAAVSTFDQWQKDVFFSAAEEVQESADTMESMYRMWSHERSDGLEQEFSDDLRRELHTALGTAKWQLEEFERAVLLSHRNHPIEDNTISRHREFVDAISNKILHVEKAIEDSLLEEGKSPLRWVQLDEEERDDFEIFLSSAPSASPEEKMKKKKKKYTDHKYVGEFKETVTINKDAKYVVEVAAKDPFEEKHKITVKEDYLDGQSKAESSSEISAWKISIADDEDAVKNLVESNLETQNHAPKVFSFLSRIESTAKLRWFRSFGKAKCEEHIRTRRGFSDYLALKGISRLAQGIIGLNERSRSCFSSYKETHKGYNVQQSGRAGGLQRHFQGPESNKLSRRLTLLLVLTIFLIVPFLFYST